MEVRRAENPISEQAVEEEPAYATKILYLGTWGGDDDHFFSASSRNLDRGYVVQIRKSTSDSRCNCPLRKPCPHMERAKQLLFYIEQKERFQSMSADELRKFKARWEPKREQQLRKVASKQDRWKWNKFYAALDTVSWLRREELS